MAEPEVPDDVPSLKRKITELQQEVETFDGKRNFFMAIYKTKEDEANKLMEQLKVSQHEQRRLENDVKAIRAQQADMKTEHMILCMQKDDHVEELKRKHRDEMTSLHKSMQGIMSEADNSEHLKSKIRSLESELDLVRNSLRGRLEADTARVNAMAARQADPPLPPRHCTSARCKEEKKNLQIQLDAAHRKLQETADSAKLPVTAQAPAARERDLFDVGDQLKIMEEKIRTQSSAIKDLESYTSVLQRQKENSQRDLSEIRTELTESLALLDRERTENASLMKTWQMANDQFLQSQRVMMADIERFQSVLTEEQTQKVREMEAADSERETQRARIDELGKQRKEQLDLLEQQGVSLLEDGSIKRAQSKTSLTSTDIFGEFEKAEPVACPDTNDASGQRAENGPIQKGLTADMQQALDAPFPEDVENKRILASMKSPNPRTELLSEGGTRFVSEEEWSRLEQELEATRRNIQKPCENCGKYDKQIKLEKQRFSDLNERYKAAQIQIKSGQKAIEELENHLKILGNTCQQQIVDMENQSTTTAEGLFVLNERFKDSVQEFQSRIMSLTSERQDALKQLRAIEKEHEELMTIKSRTIEDILPENMQLPEGSTELHQALQSVREDLVKARTAHDYLQLKSERDAQSLRDEMYAERISSQTKLEQLSAKLVALREENESKEQLQVRLSSMESEMTREAGLRQQLEQQLNEVGTRLEKSAIAEKQLKSQMQTLLSDMTSVKEQKAQLLDRVRALQSDLSDSEQVQKDFVSLSQQLQMQLEQIRQAEHEVRFEFPEDITSCQACKKNLPAVRDKHNCMHCGKVHCPDCTTKRIPSGPTRRLARVCNVCHTILDNQATPFFSSNESNKPA